MIKYIHNIDDLLLNLWDNNYTNPKRYDTFCLCITLLSISRIYYSEYNDKIGDNNYNIKFFEQILLPCISIHPNNRLSIDEIITRIKKL